MGNKNFINNDTKGFCPVCQKWDYLLAWDARTFDTLCTTRTLKREFISIMKKSSRNKGKDLNYLCPSCNEIIPSYLIKIKNFDNEEPTLEILINNENNNITDEAFENANNSSVNDKIEENQTVDILNSDFSNIYKN